jgi:hypothetical protein
MAAFTVRRALQEGQTPRLLQEHATNSLAAHASQTDADEAVSEDTAAQVRAEVVLHQVGTKGEHLRFLRDFAEWGQGRNGLRMGVFRADPAPGRH